MAARVGTGVSGSSNGSTTVASGTKSTTTGNLLVATIKTEITADVSGLTDTAGNTWVVVNNTDFAGANGNEALAYAANITGNASNVVTATLGGTGSFSEIVVEEFSGLATSSVEDGNEQISTGSSGTYTTGNITTSTTGLVVMGVGAFGAFGTRTGTAGNPDFSLGATGATYDTTCIYYLISGSAQTVTPGGGGGVQDWGAIAQAFKNSAGPPSTAILGAAPAVQVFQPIIVGFAR